MNFFLLRESSIWRLKKSSSAIYDILEK